MALFEMLYGQRCRTPLFWNQTGERKVFGPDILEEAEKQVHMVKENLRVAQSRQKSYADRKRRELSFEVGDFVTSRCHLGEVCVVSRFEASSPLDSLDCLRFCRREVK
jgi:hypothetical protein